MALRKPQFLLKPSLFVLVLLVLISGTMLALSSGGFIVNFKTAGFSALSALQKGTRAVYSSITGVVSAVQEIGVLREEYQRLTQRLENYEYMQQNNAEIRRENERLKEQLAFTTQFEYKSHPAQIIGRDPNNQYSFITINKGSRQGIKKNMPVIAVQNGTIGLVGKVLQVGYTTSMVMPIYDYDSNVSARIQNTRDVGLVSGLGWEDSSLFMKYIKKRVLPDLQYGDLVVTSGENENYLKDIPIGYISTITVQDYDSSLNIELTPVLDFGRLETVIVVDMKEINPDAEKEDNK
ncbi:MAG: rod shape-determining protein MreC [Treponema sp.]|jgi:rod shape-determining protein MreC|nr:rod shape-determining protein MreC [Treponema sp.]